jgi:dipeptidyl aminopeptidase/acylaminoacyl peptidase
MRTLTMLTAVALAVTFTLTAAGGVAVTPPTFPESYYAAWSPDGKQIAFTTDRLGSTDIFVMNADGTRQRPLLRDATSEWWPTWSPDGKRIAFVSSRADGEHGQIYSLELASGRVTRLTYSNGSDLQPDWSSDGRITFRHRAEESSQIYVMNGDGSGLRQLVSDDDFDISPRWSPDSSKIAFVGGDDEAFVDVVNADGTGRVRLTTTGSEYEPSWSPDGTRILFTTEDDDENDDIWIMNADGSGQRKLFGSLSASENGPQFSPDGKRIVFDSDPTGEWQVYTMSAAAKSLRRLTGLPRVMSSTGRRCSIIGTTGRDVLHGTSRDDVICGFGGNDVIRGAGGDDLLDGGPGNDTINGGGGDDTMLGGPGNDTFEAIDGFRDSMDGGAGRDRARLDPNDWLSSVEIFG